MGAEVDDEQRAGGGMEGQVEQQGARAGDVHLANELAVVAEDEQLPVPGRGPVDREGGDVDVALGVGGDALGMRRAGRERREGRGRAASPRVRGLREGHGEQ